jgi:hypothetical protein
MILGWQVNDDNRRGQTHAISGIRTYGLRVEGIKAYALNRAATRIRTCKLKHTQNESVS